MTAIKHDQLKPATHLIDLEFLRLDDLPALDVVAVAQEDLRRWWAAPGDPHALLHTAYARLATYLGGTHTARLELGRTLAFGAQKYGPHNWREGMEWSRVWRAAHDHLAAHLRGTIYDDETGLLHVSHALTSVMFLVVYARDGLGTDDRPKHRPNGGAK